MFKRTISAVTILMAILFLTFGGVEAANPAQNPDAASEFDYTATDAGSIGNGNGFPGGFHDPDWNIKPISPSPEPVKPKPVKPETLKPEPVKPKPVKPEPVRRDTPKPQPPIRPAVEKSDEWLIYWYVCGTDIESGRLPPGDVTRCINEVERANLSSGKVKIFMQAGGTTQWGHPNFVQNNGKVGRYLYDANKQWQQLEPLTSITTGDPKTLMSTSEGLVDFLERGKQFEQENYSDPSKIHRIFIFVDHGGGSLKGVCSDAYAAKKDSLDLVEMRKAFAEVWQTSPETTMNNPPFDVVAFDTCIMGTYETAVALEGIASYMVASQESIYGVVMFEYDQLLTQLSQNPAMSAQDFGRAICDTYMNDATNHQLQSLATMALVDVSRMPTVTAAYDAFGKKALAHAKSMKNSYAFVTYVNGLSRMSVSSNEMSTSDVGSSWRDFGWQMVDLKSFTESIAQNMPELQQASNDLINTMNGAVIYQQLGAARSKCGGLSSYYSGSFANFSKYESLSQNGLTPVSQVNLYKYMSQSIKGSGYSGVNVRNTSSSSGTNSVNADDDPYALNSENIKGGPFDFTDLRNLPAYPDESKNAAVLKLNQEQMDRVAAVRCQMALIRMAGEKDSPLMRMIFLGGNTEVQSDWKQGVFKSAFTGRWIMLDGQPVYVQVDSDATVKDENGNNTGGSEFYSIPISLNDKGYNLLVSCEYPDETFTIIGARPMIEGSDPEAENRSNAILPSAVNGEMRGLKAGDVIKPLYYVLDFPVELALNPEILKFIKDIQSGKVKLTEEETAELIKAFESTGFLNTYAGDPLTVHDQVTIQYQVLPDAGLYAYMFELVNPIGAMNGSSQPVCFTLENGDATVCSDEEMNSRLNDMFIEKFGKETLEEFNKKFEKLAKKYKELYGEDLDE